MSKKCGECANFDRSLSKCNKIQDDSIRETDTVICCPFYELKQPTLFDRITASPEVLAEKLVYYENGTGYYHSTIVFYKDYPNCPIDFNTESEAIAATVAKLREVEE